MATFNRTMVGTLKARRSNSNEMLAIGGVATDCINGYTIADFVDSANRLLAIGGKAIVEDDSTRFDVTYKKVGD